MQDEGDQFLHATFLGPRQEDKRDPHRLHLLGEHLDQGEDVQWVLPCRNSTLLLTDRRLIDLKPRLAAHGAWNVMEFSGFLVNAEIPRGSATSIRRIPVPMGPGGMTMGGELIEVTAHGKTFVFVTEPFGEGLTPEDVTRFLAAFESA